MKKSVRFASNYNYDTRKLFDFIVNLFSIEDIQDMIDGKNLIQNNKKYSNV